MLKYSDIREYIESGDVLMVKSETFVGRLIRMFTGESINHVALLVSNPSGIFVYEMREGRVGWRMTPASQWMESMDNKIVLWGKFPGENRGNVCHEVFALSQRSKKYSYGTLFKVWISQFTKKKTKGKLVCSTFVQNDWLHCGHTMFNKLADPGDFTAHAKDINHIIL